MVEISVEEEGIYISKVVREMEKEAVVTCNSWEGGKMEMVVEVICTCRVVVEVEKEKVVQGICKPREVGAMEMVEEETCRHRAVVEKEMEMGEEVGVMEMVAEVT